jgi:hypothetical protein
MDMLAAIDHFVIAGPDLDALGSWWAEQAGTAADAGGAHTGLGTRNLLAGIDSTTYVELIGPDVDQPDHDGERPFGINDLAERRLVTFALAVDDLDTACAAVRNVGVDPGTPRAMQRLKPDGTTLEWRLAVPTDPMLAGVMPFLIEWGATAHPAAELSRSADLRGIQLRHPDHVRISDALEALTGAAEQVKLGDPFVGIVLTSVTGAQITI